ncbi:MAG: APC family permease [Hyphomicrobiales bacterium]
MLSQQGKLKRGVRIWDVVALGVGAAVGVAIFSVLSPAAKVAGPGLLFALAVAAIPMFIFAVVYAFMGSAIPTSGASFEWPARFVHPFAGFLIAWLRILGSTGAMVVLALVMVRYVSTAIELPVKPTMFALFLFFFVINLLGVRIAASVQTVMLAVKLAAFAIFVAFGLSSVDMANFASPLATGWGPIFAAVPLLVSLYLGIESATEVGEEIEDSENVIAKGIGISVGLAILVYGAVAFVALGTLGAKDLAASQAPLTEAGKRFLGDWTSVIIIAAALAFSTTLNSVFMIFTRYLFAMGRGGVLPAALASIHPKWGTPHVATCVAFACCLLGLLLPTDLIFLFLAVNIPTMLKYMGSCGAAIRIAHDHPDIVARARFRLSAGWLKVWAWLGVACAFGIVVIGFNTDWRPYAVLGAWGLLGALYWAAAGRRHLVTS